MPLTYPVRKKMTEHSKNQEIKDRIHVGQLYQNWFLDYASYVILERAVPLGDDGLKPVQRRILHAMKTMDDGRFHKVANVIGQTMQYHPHGDAAIGDALVHLGQKKLLVETQGNWGDIRTGDRAAAPRYIEARLSEFALETIFSPAVTSWQDSYDGRKKEPIALPAKFPLLLSQGAEGIAVGLSTKILPHNFNELIDATIDILQGKETDILPDFPCGGQADFTNYNGGEKGSKVRVRAEMEIVDRKTLRIYSIPYNTTTSQLVDSIIKANNNGKIKIKRVLDNTAKDVEIVVELPNNVSPEVTIDALYAFTDCEISISPNCCVILEGKPHFLNVNELLKFSTLHSVDLLRQELEICKAELEAKWFQSILEKIFIENRFYREIEECENWQQVIDKILKAFEPFREKFPRKIKEEDIQRLTEIKIKRISKYNSEKAKKLIEEIESSIQKTQYNLEHIIDYAIKYFSSLKGKYGKLHSRKTEIRKFDFIEVAQVAVANQKLYMDPQGGFIGYGLKKNEFVCECSDMDDVIVFLRNGKFKVVRISNKIFIGKDIIYADIWRKNDNRKIYNVIYHDSISGNSYAKRFAVKAITRDKEYDLTKEGKGSKILYFSANPNGETESVSIHLQPRCRARKKIFDFNFAELSIKGRGAQGNIVARYPITKVKHKESIGQTFQDIDVWYDESVGRLNTEKRGELLGKFKADDAILVITKDGKYTLTTFDPSNRYDSENIQIIEKFSPETIISTIYYHGKKKQYFVKRFQIETQIIGKTFSFISEEKDSRMILVSTKANPYIELTCVKKRPIRQEKEIINVEQFINIKGWKSLGNRLCFYEVVSIKFIEMTESTKIGEKTETIAVNQELEFGRENLEISKEDSENQEENISREDSENQVENISREDSENQEENIAQESEEKKQEKDELNAEVEETETTYIQDSLF